MLDQAERAAARIARYIFEGTIGEQFDRAMAVWAANMQAA
jgi:hypothetical protein